MKGRSKCFFCVTCPLLIAKRCWVNDRDGRRLVVVRFGFFQLWDLRKHFVLWRWMLFCGEEAVESADRFSSCLHAFVERYYSVQNVSSLVIVSVFLFPLLYSRAGWGLPGAVTAVWWGWGSVLVLCLTVLQGWRGSVRNAQSWAHVPRLVTDQCISRLYIDLLPRSSRG